MDPIERKTPAKAMEEGSDFTTTIDDDEPAEAEFRASIRRSMRQALAGETRPAEEALKEIRRELADYADARQDH